MPNYDGTGAKHVVTVERLYQAFEQFKNDMVSQSKKEIDTYLRSDWKDITNLAKDGTLSRAIREGNNLEKYGITIGDYFKNGADNPNTYWIADKDTFFGRSNNKAYVNKRHVVILASFEEGENGNYTDSFAKSEKNSPTLAGYLGSDLHKDLKNSDNFFGSVKHDFQKIFGADYMNHFITHSILATNSVGSYAYEDNCYIVAPTESQIYGHPVWGSDGYQDGEGFKKLAIFDKCSVKRIIPHGTWLRSLWKDDNNYYPCYVNDNGIPSATKKYSDSKYIVGLILFQ